VRKSSPSCLVGAHAPARSDGSAALRRAVDGSLGDVAKLAVAAAVFAPRARSASGGLGAAGLVVAATPVVEVAFVALCALLARLRAAPGPRPGRAAPGPPPWWPAPLAAALALAGVVGAAAATTAMPAAGWIGFALLKLTSTAAAVSAVRAACGGRAGVAARSLTDAALAFAFLADALLAHAVMLCVLVIALVPCADRIHTRMLYRISPLASETRLRAEMDRAFGAAKILRPDDPIASLSDSLPKQQGSLLRHSWGSRQDAFRRDIIDTEDDDPFGPPRATATFV